MSRRATVILLLAAFFLTGCFPTLERTPEKVVADISSTLKLGDPAETIEAYFREHGLQFSYNRVDNKYQAIIRHPDSNFHAISIHVLLDSQKRYAGVEANDSYTFL